MLAAGNVAVAMSTHFAVTAFVCEAHGGWLRDSAWQNIFGASRLEEMWIVNFILSEPNSQNMQRIKIRPKVCSCAGWHGAANAWLLQNALRVKLSAART